MKRNLRFYAPMALGIASLSVLAVGPFAAWIRLVAFGFAAFFMGMLLTMVAVDATDSP